jgi:hypothetical protein
MFALNYRTRDVIHLKYFLRYWQGSGQPGLFGCSRWLGRLVLELIRGQFFHLPLLETEELTENR